MDQTVTLQTLLIATVPFGVLLLLTLFISAIGGTFQAAWLRVLGRPSPIRELERRIATLEAALKRARASELPIEIEAERLAAEIYQLEARQSLGPPGVPPANWADWSNRTPAPDRAHEISDAGNSEDQPPAESTILIELPPEPGETDEDRTAREQLEAEERERIARVAAEETRVREEREQAERQARDRREAKARGRQEEQEERERIERERREEQQRIQAERQREADRIEAEQQREEQRIEQARLEAEAERQREEERIEAERQRVEQARLEAEAERQREIERIEADRRREVERIERERLEAVAARKREEEQQRKTEEFRRRVADATPKIVMSAGGSNREAATINIAVTNSLTPKHAEIAVLSASWAWDPAPATFAAQRKDGLFEERWPRHPSQGAIPQWSTYQDASGRTFDCPDDAPTETQAWIVISYDRTVGGPASTWQRFEVGGAGALWYVRQPIGDPILIEARRDGQQGEAA